MKKIILLLFVSSFVLCYSCKKDKSNTGTQTPFAFTSLNASDTVVNVTTTIHIIATATGDGLTYTWASADLNGNPYGTIIGSGANIQWNVCHNDRFKVTCTVSDSHSNSASKDIIITSKQ